MKTSVALRPLLVLGLVGCNPSRGHVDVVARPITAGLYETLVVFADRDGESRIAVPDAEDRAGGEVEAGGSVWFAQFSGMVTGINRFAAYLDVQPGETLEFGPSLGASTPRGTMTITGTPPAGASYIKAVTTCGSRAPNPFQLTSDELTFDDRCGATADVLVVAYRRVNPMDEITSYAYLPARTIMNGATITIDPDDWRSPEPVTINLLNAPTISERWLANEFDVRSTNGATGVVLPLVGSELRLTVGVRLDPVTPGQTIRLNLPVQASQDVDINQAIAPWVYKREDDLAWSADDGGGTLAAHAMVTEYQWEQPIANYMEYVSVRLLSSVQEPGTLELPSLPDALDKYQPDSDFRVNSKVRLVRMEGGDPSTILRTVERATYNAPVSALLLGDLPARSLAFTDFF